MPEEFDRDTAMGLFANIPAVEAAQSIALAKGIAMAFGDGDLMAESVYAMTGNARLARNIKVRAAMRKAANANG